MTTATTREADRLREQFNATADDIRSRTELRPEVIQARLARAYLQFRDRMTELQRTSTSQRTTDTAAHKRTLFGIDDLVADGTGDRATLAVSLRDAQERAAQIGDSNEALRVLDQAELVGDSVLAQAVFNHWTSAAAPMGADVGPIAERFLSNRPDKAEAWNALQDANQRLTFQDMFEFVAPQPPELNGVSAGQMQHLAKQVQSSPE